MDSRLRGNDGVFDEYLRCYAALPFEDGHGEDYEEARRDGGMSYPGFRGVSPVTAMPKKFQKELEFCHRKTDNPLNKTRQGYARKRTLKPAGYFFPGSES